jgi:hypothetical protein
MEIEGFEKKEGKTIEHCWFLLGNAMALRNRQTCYLITSITKYPPLKRMQV